MLHEETDTVAEFWIAETGELHRQSLNSTYGVVRDICGELVNQEYKSGDCLKMSIDGGGGFVKVIINHQGEAISFEGKGERQILNQKAHSFVIPGDQLSSESFEATCTSTLKAEHMKCPSFAGNDVTSLASAV